MPASFRDVTHLLRMAMLFAVGIAAFLAVRTALVPDDFGRYGHYRAGAIADNAAHPAVFAGEQACLACHDDIAELRAGGAHAGVRCEACHGPRAAHVDDPSISAMALGRGDTCLVCHDRLGAKPAGFPQVDAEEHAMGEACVTCHDAHAPGFGGG